MRIIQMPRGSGKTYRLVKYSAKHNIPILVRNNADKERYLEIAKAEGLVGLMPTPLSLSDLPMQDPVMEEVLVDDIDKMLDHLLGIYLKTKCAVGTLNNG